MTATDIKSVKLMTVTDIDPSRRKPCAQDGPAKTEVFLMRVFVTGASGWIGSAVVPELISAGHQVTGLARSDASAAALAAAGAQPHRGDLDDVGSLRDAAAAAGGVIHLAFKHDLAFTGDFQGAADSDRRAVETFGDALADSGRPLLIASGTLGLAPGRVGTEQDGHGPAPEVATMGAGPRTRPATPSPRAASAPASSAPPRRCTATETTASWRPWSPSPATRAPPATSATGPAAGPPCTASTPRASSDWRWSRPGPDRRCTPSRTRACRSATSPQSSAAT